MTKSCRRRDIQTSFVIDHALEILKNIGLPQAYSYLVANGISGKIVKRVMAMPGSRRSYGKIRFLRKSSVDNRILWFQKGYFLNFLLAMRMGNQSNKAIGSRLYPCAPSKQVAGHLVDFRSSLRNYMRQSTQHSMLIITKKATLCHRCPLPPWSGPSLS